MKRKRAVRRALGALACLLLSATPANATGAPQSASLKVTLNPERLGHSTTVRFSFQIAAPEEHVPSPLTAVDISYPLELEIALSELGLAACTTEALETFGPQGCPTNSIMGYGTAIAEIPIGPVILHETAQVTIVRTTNQSGHIALLIAASGETPVSAAIVFPGVILPAPPPFGGQLSMSIPLVPSLPGAPNVAVVQFATTIGPEHLKYNEQRKGHTYNYEPRGIPLPTTCPKSGFVFSATFSFLDGTHTGARAAVPCPHRRRSRSPAPKTTGRHVPR